MVIFRVVSWSVWVAYSTFQAVASSVAPYLAAAGSEDGSVRATMPTSDRGDHQPAAAAGDGSSRGVRSGGGCGAFVDPARAIPEHRSAPFGNPADSESPVALRPRLATGVPFRGAGRPRGDRGTCDVWRPYRTRGSAGQRRMGTGRVGRVTTKDGPHRPPPSPTALMAGRTGTPHPRARCSPAPADRPWAVATGQAGAPSAGTNPSSSRALSRSHRRRGLFDVP